MTVATVTIPLEEDAAQIYLEASEQKKEALSLLISLWLREFESISLSALMDQISDNAQKRGLTPEILDSLLNDI
ncbi:MAG: hypothetical protein AAF702_46900 [Chloroflexota bacterium]